VHFDSTKTRPASSFGSEDDGSPVWSVDDDPEHPDASARSASAIAATTHNVTNRDSADARIELLQTTGPDARLFASSLPDVPGGSSVNAHRRREFRTAIIFVTVAALIYLLRYVIFGHPDEMLRYLMDDIAFVLIQALIIWLVLDRVIRRMEREALQQKLNMVIGAFYSEVGTTLMGSIAVCDADFDRIRPSVIVKYGWTPADFAAAKASLQSHDYRIDVRPEDLPALKALLGSERSFLLGLLENQNLLEHQAFTELLWAVFHLAEELAVRPDLSHLPRADLLHIASDMKRAYGLLISQWLDYMAHLQAQYPYLFSLAVRTNPLDPEASVIITE